MDINIMIDLFLKYSSFALMIIGAASLILKYITPLTKNTIDDRIYMMLEDILKFLSQARDESLKIKVKNDK